VEPEAEMVAVVGARRCTPYGEELAFELGAGLARAGMVVVSGLALGIDSAAHRGALFAGGRTVAVMGTGPDQVYPPRNRRLAAQIASQGALVTQFEVGMRALRWNFPARNATISGMSLGGVVVEARVKSGAMLTAGSAGAQGRAVMALPGSVRNPCANGCHELIRDGARLVTGAEQVVQELRSEPLARLLAPAVEGRAAPYGDLRDHVIEELIGRSLTLDEIASRLGAPAREVATATAQLRLDRRLNLRAGAYSLAGVLSVQ
jgi:DNA processing protein